MLIFSNNLALSGIKPRRDRAASGGETGGRFRLMIQVGTHSRLAQ